jgi:hypothetical protein
MGAAHHRPSGAAKPPAQAEQNSMERDRDRALARAEFRFRSSERDALAA